MFWTPSILHNIYRCFISNQNLKGIFAIFAIFRFAPSHFLDQQKADFESTDMKLDIGVNKKYRWLDLQCKQLANGVSNCLEPLLIFP